jgi:hypothetical protein
VRYIDHQQVHIPFISSYLYNSTKSPRSREITYERGERLFRNPPQDQSGSVNATSTINFTTPSIRHPLPPLGNEPNGGSRTVAHPEAYSALQRGRRHGKHPMGKVCVGRWACVARVHRPRVHGSAGASVKNERGEWYVPAAVQRNGAARGGTNGPVNLSFSRGLHLFLSQGSARSAVSQ